MAQLDRAGIKSRALQLFPNNTRGDISPMDIRAIVDDLVDSFSLMAESRLPDANYILGLINGRISYNSLAGRPNLFSGRYADLSGKPQLFSGAFADLSGRPAANAYLPINGTTGYFLAKTDTGREWRALPMVISALTQAQYDRLAVKDPNVLYAVRSE